jgi:short-subunit dehydrogenase
VRSRPAAIVTGASRGIGAEIAKRLAAAGYDLTISARGHEALERQAAEIRGEFDAKVHPRAANMAEEDQVRELATAHRDTFGRADVLVLNAGMGARGAFADFPVKRLDTLYKVNLRSAYVLAQELLPLLRRAGQTRALGGKILAVASTTGVVGEPLNSAYGSTKAALISWCETLNTEESTGGVTATAVCPGYVATAMTESLAETVAQETMLDIADVAEAVLGLTRLSRRVVVPKLVLVRPGSHLWRA